MADTLVYVYNVEMTCEGCAGAVKKVLDKEKGKGIESFEISLPAKKVTVTTSLTADQVLEIIRKTGKTSSYSGEVKK